MLDYRIKGMFSERVMKECPKCCSKELVKNGFVKGKQRYKCKDCSYNPSVQRKSSSPPMEVKRFALSMYLEGLGFNSIGRLLHVSHVSVMNWIRQFGQVIEEFRSVEPAGVVEIDEMHSYIGYKKMRGGCGLLWIEQRGATWRCTLVTGARKQAQNYGRKSSPKPVGQSS